MSPTDADLRLALESYDASLSTRAGASKASSDLVALDAWYRTTLRTSLSSSPTALTVEQLGRLMEWKLARGKWRPKLVEMANSNPQTLLTSCTPPSPTATAKVSLTALCSLKGVGPATASAILSLYFPKTEPFLSDEAFEAMGLGKAEYTVKGWEKFRAAMEKRLADGKWETMEELEKACWSWGVREKYGDGGEGEKKEVKGKKDTKRKAPGADAVVDVDAAAEKDSPKVAASRPSRAKKSKAT
ncbi:hypothetical protein RQP46_010642 [Phenoliferia psychrophenolica]